METFCRGDVLSRRRFVHMCAAHICYQDWSYRHKRWKNDPLLKKILLFATFHYTLFLYKSFMQIPTCSAALKITWGLWSMLILSPLALNKSTVPAFFSCNVIVVVFSLLMSRAEINLSIYIYLSIYCTTLKFSKLKICGQYALKNVKTTFIVVVF
jgi:hypothetical protein